MKKLGTFREWLSEKECREGKETYKDFFNKKLEKYGVKSATELSGEDKKKFFDEVDAEWEGEKEEPEVGDVNESNKPNWDDAEKATKKVADLFKGHSKITSKNSLTIEVDGIVGKIVFDPTF